jgi:hypothetical protein
MADEHLVVTYRDDYGGSGRVTRIYRGDVVVWTWAWHIDGPPSSDCLSLLRALGVSDG